MKIIVSGGGTGGHIYPGVAVAEEILNRSPGSRVLFIGTDRPADKRAFSGAAFQSATLNCHGLKGKSPADRLKSLAELPFSLIQALRLIKGFKPDLVLGVGGYVTGPVMLAARILRKPTCIHEQNSIPGLANRLTGKFVDRIFVTYPDSEGFFPAGKCVFTGNPVRGEIAAAARASDQGSRPHAGGVLSLGVLGGSLGAHRINTLVVDMLAGLQADLPEEFQVLHQTGAADEKRVREAYQSAGITAQVSDFFNDMASFYQQADVIVSRAGATSLAEITVMGIPAILIPYPYAADDHQRKNAEFMVRGGAAKMVVEEGLTADRLAKEVFPLLTVASDRLEMAEASKLLARPDALEAIVKECEKMVKG